MGCICTTLTVDEVLLDVLGAQEIIDIVKSYTANNNVFDMSNRRENDWNEWFKSIEVHHDQGLFIDCNGIYKPPQLLFKQVSYQRALYEGTDGKIVHTIAVDDDLYPRWVERSSSITKIVDSFLYPLSHQERLSISTRKDTEYWETGKYVVELQKFGRVGGYLYANKYIDDIRVITMTDDID